jgi:cholesterol transport system auxiliary component
MNGRRLALRGSLAAWSLLMASCSASLWPKPAPARLRYALDDAVRAEAPQDPKPPPAGPSAPVLVVALPRPMPGHEGSLMLYQRHPQEVEAYTESEWVAPPAQMLAPLLVRALQQTGAYSAVLLAPSGLAGAQRLECEFVALQQLFGSGPSRVRLSLRAVILESATRQVRAWQDFEQSVPAATDDAAGGAAAATLAAHRLSQAVAAWCAGLRVAR